MKGTDENGKKKEKWSKDDFFIAAVLLAVDLILLLGIIL